LPTPPPIGLLATMSVFPFFLPTSATSVSGLGQHTLMWNIPTLPFPLSSLLIFFPSLTSLFIGVGPCLSAGRVFFFSFLPFFFFLSRFISFGWLTDFPAALTRFFAPPPPQPFFPTSFCPFEFYPTPILRKRTRELDALFSWSPLKIFFFPLSPRTVFFFVYLMIFAPLPALWVRPY